MRREMIAAAVLMAASWAVFFLIGFGDVEFGSKAFTVLAMAGCVCFGAGTAVFALEDGKADRR